MREEHRLRVFENRVLRRIFGSKRDEVREEWKKINNEELNDLYSPSGIFWAIKWRRMRWAGHTASMGGGVYTGFWWGNVRGRDHLEDSNIDGRIILKWIFRKWDVGTRTG